MTTSALLEYVQSLGVELWAEGDRLRYNSPKGVLTPDLRAELAANKAELLALLQQVRPHVQSSSPPPIRQAAYVAPDEEWPLSFAQQRLWFLDRLEPGNPFYTISL